jgi:hypothetical protein
VPVKSILRDFVSLDDGEDEGEEEVKGAKTGAGAEAGAETETERERETEAGAERETEGGAEAETEAKEDAKKESEAAPPPVNEIIMPIAETAAVAETAAPAGPPTIVVDTRDRVNFSDFDTVFDDNPDGSDLVYEPKDRHTEESSGVDILEGEAMPLEDGDLDRLDGEEDDDAATIGEEATDLAAGDYDVLV